MAKTFVGRTSGSASNGGSVALTINSGLTGGSRAAIQAGDLVICGGADGNTGTVSWSGVTGVIDNGQNSTPSAQSELAYLKCSGSETTVTFNGTGNSNSSVAAFAEVWEGADYDSSVAPTTATGSSTNPDCPSITPDEANTMVGAFAFTRTGDVSGTGAPTNYTNFTQVAGTADLNDVTCYHATRDGRSSGVSENPGAFTGVSTASWRAVTYCIKDASTSADFALSKTLGALTSSAAATVDITASVSKTLGALTSSAASSVDITASLAKTLGTLTSSAVVAATTPGDCALTKTLGALTVSGTVTVDINASVSKTLGTLTGSAASTVTIDATLSKTLGVLSLSSVATLSAAADLSLSKTLANVTSSAAASVAISASLSKTLGTLTSSAASSVDITAALSKTLGTLTLSAAVSGQAELAATITLDALMSSGILFKWDGAADEDGAEWSAQTGGAGLWTEQSGQAGSWSNQSGGGATWTPQSASAGPWTRQ